MLELWVLTAIILAIVSGLIIYIAVLKLNQIHQVTISDTFDRKLIEKVVNLPVDSKVRLESEIDMGLHDDHRES